MFLTVVGVTRRKNIPRVLAKKVQGICLLKYLSENWEGVFGKKDRTTTRVFKFVLISAVSPLRDCKGNVLEM